MNIEESKIFLNSRSFDKNETLKLTIQRDGKFKKTKTGEIIIFDGVRGALLEKKEPNIYTFIVRAHPLKTYLQKLADKDSIE